MKANINGFSMNFEDTGSGPAVVLLHGFPFCNEMWLEQIKFFSEKKYRVIAPDLRGYGESEYAPLENMGDFSDDVASLLEYLGVEKAVIGGMSMGGYILLDFLERHPLRVSGAVFMVTRAGADNEAGKAKRTDLAERTRSGQREAVPDTFGPILFAPESYEKKADMVRRVREWGLKADPRAVSESLIAMRDRKDYLNELEKFSFPTLVIGGALDRTIPPENSEAIARALPNAKLEIIPGVGHMANMENPAAFNEVLLKFLQGL